MAFAGRSNVGKSTLLNRLCQRKALARTSRTPGCTRGVVLYRCSLRDGTAFHLADLPGYGYAERSHAERRAWADHLEAYLQRRASLRVVVILVDARRGVEDEERQLITWLRAIHRPFVIGATKVDKLPRSEQSRALAALQAIARVPVIPTSGETGTGREALLQAVLRFVSPPALQAHHGTPSAPEGPAADGAGTVLAHVPTR